MGNLAFQLGAWASMLPTALRKRFYQGVKYLGMVATLAVLVLPELDGAGLHWSYETTALAIATALVGVTGHLADRNTSVDPGVDVTSAPEAEAQAALDATPEAN